MTGDGVLGTPGVCHRVAGPPGAIPDIVFTFPRDESCKRRYMGPIDPHTPAAATPRAQRCERQAASVLRDCSHSLTVDPITGNAVLPIIARARLR